MICCSSPKIYSRNGFCPFLGRMQAALNPFLPLSSSFKGIFFRGGHSLSDISLFSSVTQSCLTLCDPTDCSTLSITNSWSLLKLMSIKLVMPSNHLILCHPLLLLSSVFPSIRVFSSESVLLIRWPKFQWVFRANSLRVDWFDLLAVQGTLKSLL